MLFAVCRSDAWFSRSDGGGGGAEKARAGKKYRLVDNIGARLGSEANFGSHKIKISSYEINCIGKIWLNMKDAYKLIARNASGKTGAVKHNGG